MTVIGNTDGSKLPDMSHFLVGVVTRAQAKQKEKAYKKLKVPDQILSENKQAFQDAQMSDPKRAYEPAHVSLMAGHLGIKKTLNRILAELFWPGIYVDVTRFCRLCYIFQGTV